MDSQAAKRLFQYVTNSQNRRTGVSEDEAMGSGPGGAGATNRRVSRQLANLSKNPLSTRGEREDIRADVSDLKMGADMRGMKSVMDLYQSATSMLKKKRFSRDMRFGDEI